MVILLIATSAVVLVCSIPLVVSLHSSSFMCFCHGRLPLHFQSIQDL
uniref:Uncharacterized protein n=1 Tax=Anguilla anguilla TaxID=7936 RepID=A0A0E9SJJ1_ANGAN